MTDNMKGAIAACVLMLPICAGVGWVADIFTRAAFTAAVISHGDAVPNELMQPLWPRMIIPGLLMYFFVCAFVLGLAKLGFGPRHTMIPAPPLPHWPGHSQVRPPDG